MATLTNEDLDRLDALCNAAPTYSDWSGVMAPDVAYEAALDGVVALLAEVRRLREYTTLLEQAAGTMIQVQRERSAPVFERSTVFSRPECVFKYCASPLDCQERCMLVKPDPADGPTLLICGSCGALVEVRYNGECLRCATREVTG